MSVPLDPFRRAWTLGAGWSSGCRSRLGRVQAALLGALVVLGASAQVWAVVPPELGQWLRERGAEQENALRAAPRRADAQKVWRERGADADPLPGFRPPTSLAPLVKVVRSAVVNLSTVDGAGDRGPSSRSLGSGFLISAEGHVVTNNHVVERARQITVRLADGREFPVGIVGRDPSTDVALLRIQGEALGELPHVYLGDSDALEVGDWVVAIGNPFGLDHSVAHGMISAKERVIGIGVFDDFIQTDALINPGNSGGPLFNMRGEVIGVNSAIMSRGQGIGFAVPINMVKDLLPNLLVNGRLARGWLGVNIQETTTNGAEKGAVVKDVFRNSPAAQAGLKPGDKVSAVNGRPIENYLQLLRRIAIFAPGTSVKLSVQRGSKQDEVAAVLGERPAPESLQVLGQSPSAEAMGLVVQDIDPSAAARLGVPAGSGALVVGVVPSSPADRAGLQPGDVVTEVNRSRIQGATSLGAALKQGKGPTALLRIQRGSSGRYVAVRPE